MNKDPTTSSVQDSLGLIIGEYAITSLHREEIVFYYHLAISS
jgi:hypothetical protein